MGPCRRRDQHFETTRRTTTSKKKNNKTTCDKQQTTNNKEETNKNSKLRQATAKNLQEDEGTDVQISDAGRQPDADQHAAEPWCTFVMYLLTQSLQHEVFGPSVPAWYICQEPSKLHTNLLNPLEQANTGLVLNEKRSYHEVGHFTLSGFIMDSVYWTLGLIHNTCCGDDLMLKERCTYCCGML